jgi:predicted NBD/HSP70 family sugar kinase
MPIPSSPSIRIADVRDHNLRAVAEYVALHPGVSRTDVARALGLSATSIGRIIDNLRSAGLIHEGVPISNGIGRPQTPLALRANAALVAGVSVRPRSVRLRLADLAGTPIASHETERNDESPQALAAQIASEIEAARQRSASSAPIAGVTVGISGVWDSIARRVYAAPKLSILEGVDFEREIADALHGVAPHTAVSVDNDVNCALAGELAFGAARGIGDAFYLSIGSGIGGAALVAGAIQRGAAGFAGELGYLIVHDHGHSCPLESWLPQISPIHDTTPPTPSARDRELAETAGRILGQALIAVVTTLNPRLVVLGGSIGRSASHWTAPIERHLRLHLPVTPPVVLGRLGREASLVGAVEAARYLARTALIAGEVEPRVEEP